MSQVLNWIWIRSRVTDEFECELEFDFCKINESEFEFRFFKVDEFEFNNQKQNEWIRP